MRVVKVGALALVIVLAVYGGVTGYTALRAELAAYRTQQAQVEAMFRYLAAEVGTRTADNGTTAPLSRADLLAAIAAERLAQAQK
jgi:hypothetical protein